MMLSIHRMSDSVTMKSGIKLYAYSTNANCNMGRTDRRNILLCDIEYSDVTSLRILLTILTLTSNIAVFLPLGYSPSNRACTNETTMVYSMRVQQDTADLTCGCVTCSLLH